MLKMGVYVDFSVRLYIARVTLAIVSKAARSPRVFVNNTASDHNDISQRPHLWSNGQRVWLRNQVARVRIPVGASYLVEVFSGVFPQPNTCKCWVEEVEGASLGTHHHLHHSPDSGGGGGASSSSSSPLPPLALRRPHRPQMVDSTGVGPGPSSGPPGQTSTSTAGDDTTPSGAAGGTLSEGSASESSPRQSGVQSLVTSREEDGEEDGHGGDGDDTGSKRDSIASSDKSPGQRYLLTLIGQPCPLDK
ncbi:hypothetical protein ANN_07233 [Periplaneta americana]|uniref:Uncharacterized protein n=1 Tax=Periplaneta americana TaxID=6978 RepID=A0ABQ8THR2_PERAM|nr:hypothetical protein ANN_07233 [Periplaneta americana]